MQIGLVGLGRMGANMSRRWLRAGHSVVGYARHAETVNGLLADKAISGGATSLKDLVGQLATPRVLWLMLPAAAVDATLDELVPLLARDDVVVDGAATPTTSTTSAAPERSRSRESTTSTAGPAAAWPAWSEATA